jgi:hypothetical protein
MGYAKPSQNIAANESLRRGRALRRLLGAWAVEFTEKHKKISNLRDFMCSAA